LPIRLMLAELDSQRLLQLVADAGDPTQAQTLAKLRARCDRYRGELK
jgi:hypothetical protein